jgi:putative membrane protein
MARWRKFTERVGPLPVGDSPVEESKMKYLAYGAALSALALGACHKNSDNSAAYSDENATNEAANNAGAATTVDAAFVTDAMKGDNGEVAIGKLAEAQASSQAAKDFGKMLETDHGAHKDKLAALASANNIPVTDEPSEEGKANLDKLKALKGAEFDKAFKAAMIDDHQKDIAKYEKQASSGDATTAALAKETLPTLRKHLSTAQSL